MKIIKASYEIIDDLDYKDILNKIERAARVCYASEDKQQDGSAERLISSCIKRGHESVLEHFSFSVEFIADRAFLAEITRHRLASFSVESQRYVAYNKKKDLSFIQPCFWGEDDIEMVAWENAISNAELSYLSLMSNAHTKPEEARTTLPNSTATKIFMTANLREWRHILKLRTEKAAHPQMREVMIPLLNELKEKLPVFFTDIEVKS